MVFWLAIMLHCNIYNDNTFLENKKASSFVSKDIKLNVTLLDMASFSGATNFTV